MNKIDKFTKAILDSQKDKNTKPYDTTAKVVRVVGDTAYVHIAGGVTETPATLAINAKEGDDVRVHVTGGKAYVMGNPTSPPTDDSLAEKAQQNALKAAKAANEAVTQAEIAHESAKSAQADAKTANQSAIQAIEDAKRAHDAADSAQADAIRAEESADRAQEAAEHAQADATTASQASTVALNQLSIIEDVVGVLDLLSQHGEYALSSDTTVQPNIWYFRKEGTAPNEKYIVVNPSEDANPSEEGWYTLVSVDQAVQNYVSSHLALTSEGLYLQSDGVATRLLLSPTQGLVVMGQNGPLATYGSQTLIGDANSFHVTIGNQELGFWKDANTKVAYVKSDSLYIEKSVVVQRMDVGEPVASGGKGQWTWRVHDNNGRNNLSLKWLG